MIEAGQQIIILHWNNLLEIWKKVYQRRNQKIKTNLMPLKEKE